MKRVLFLQDLGLTRQETRNLLEKVNCRYEPIWNQEFDIDKVRDDVELLVTSDHKVNIRSLKKQWPNLKMVSLAFTGFDGVDLAFAHSKGIRTYYVPGYATSSVAELNLALTLSILRRIPTADRTIRKGEWHNQVYPGIELAEKIVGIVGTGTIGLQTAHLFRAFGCSIIGWSRSVRDEFIEIGGTYVSEEAVFSESEIVVLCLQLNNNTRHFVGRTQFERMKKGAILINTARSELVDKAALLSVLAQEKIFAGIDVFEEKTEKGSKDELFKFENAILTPHLGFKTKEALQRLAEQAIQNIGRFLAESDENLLK
jgi:phosphoglycerate dehydrogenase-like enzyme